MPTLLELQSMMRMSLCGNADNGVLAFLTGDLASAEALLQIHRNSYVATLLQSLRVSFPAVRKLVGDKFFDMTAQKFIENHPPRNAWLDSYGTVFPDFLVAFPLVTSLPYLSDVARLEVQVNHALHASDTDYCDADALTALAALYEATAVSIRFEPHPSLGLLRCNGATDTIWSAVLADDDARLAAIEPDSEPVWLLIARSRHGVEVKRLDQPTWLFLAALANGVQLGTAADAMPDKVDVAAILADCFENRRFRAYSMIV